VRELKGFAKVRLAAGASTTVSLQLEPRAFAYYDVGDEFQAQLLAGLPVPAESGHARRLEAGWYVDPGEYRIVVGRSSADLVASTSVTVTGEALRLPS
jgi:beta-glucosidase